MNRKYAAGSLALAFLLTAGIFLFERRDVSAPRYVFIDGGAHKGESVAHFKQTDIYKKHKWEIFAFEANPYLIPDFPKSPDVTVLNKAIWNQDGEIEFYLSENTLSSSLKKDKTSGNLSPVPTIVASVDFGQWLKKTFSLEDYIIVKLDIEGAEYDVLEKMLSDGTAPYMDRLYVEFHDQKVGEKEEKDKKILSELRRNNVAVDSSGSDRPGDWFGFQIKDASRYGMIFFSSLLAFLLVFRVFAGCECNCRNKAP